MYLWNFTRAYMYSTLPYMGAAADAHSVQCRILPHPPAHVVNKIVR